MKWFEPQGEPGPQPACGLCLWWHSVDQAWLLARVLPLSDASSMDCGDSDADQRLKCIHQFDDERVARGFPAAETVCGARTTIWTRSAPPAPRCTTGGQHPKSKREAVTEVNGQPGAMAIDAQDRLVG